MISNLLYLQFPESRALFYLANQDIDDFVRSNNGTLDIGLQERLGLDRQVHVFPNSNEFLISYNHLLAFVISVDHVDWFSDIGNKILFLYTHDFTKDEPSHCVFFVKLFPTLLNYFMTLPILDRKIPEGAVNRELVYLKSGPVILKSLMVDEGQLFPDYDSFLRYEAWISRISQDL